MFGGAEAAREERLTSKMKAQISKFLGCIILFHSNHAINSRSRDYFVYFLDVVNRRKGYQASGEAGKDLLRVVSGLGTILAGDEGTKGAGAGEEFLRFSESDGGKEAG